MSSTKRRMGAGGGARVPLSEQGKRRRTTQQVDDERADAGRATNESKRYGLPQHATAKKHYTHVMSGEKGVRFVQSQDDPTLWGVFSASAALSERMPGAGDTVTVLERKTKEPKTLVVEDASAMSQCYWMLSVRR
jgi:hypothetical protein